MDFRTHGTVAEVAKDANVGVINIKARQQVIILRRVFFGDVQSSCGAAADAGITVDNEIAGLIRFNERVQPLIIILIECVVAVG